MNVLGTFVLLATLLVGCVAPVHAAAVQPAAAPITNRIDTCVGNGPEGLFLIDMRGTQPGAEQVAGDDADCFKSDPSNPRYLVIENPMGGPRSVISVAGMSREDIDQFMDSSTGSYYR